MHKRPSIWVFLMLSLIFGCGPEDFDLDLPAYESELVVEGYLHDLRPAKVLVTESVSYYEEASLPVITGALVTLTHKGVTDTLKFNPQTFFYEGKEVNRDESAPFFLRVEDPEGRVATAETWFMPVIPLDSIVSQRESYEEKARIYLYWMDPPGGSNKYRVTAAYRNGNKDYSIELNDALFDGQSATWVTKAKYNPGRKVIVRLYHLEPAYYRFLTSVWNAGLSGQGPISEPTSIVSNIEGGLGIFTTLNFSQLEVHAQ